MKPMGAIPAELRGMQLAIGGRPVAELATQTPAFIYDMTIVAARVARFRAAFRGIDLHYAVKANPFAPLLKSMAPLVDGFDVASVGELERVQALGKAVSFAGPGKRDMELKAAISAGVTVNFESEAEADRALAIANRVGKAPLLAVRVNPDFELRGSGMRMGGRASPFGVDADRAAALVRRIVDSGADWRGFHIFAGSQSLDTQAIIDSQAHTLELAIRLADEIGAMPPSVNLGGGFGLPYFPGEVPLDIEVIGAALAPRLEALPQTRFAIELGRWLVGEAGVYLTRVIDRKGSRGETFLVCDGGLNHQLAATGNFGTVVRRNYPIAVATAAPDAPTETVTVVGPLCTPLDRLADQVELPVAWPGDVIAIFMAGAYGLTASPWEFLGHSRPVELLVGAAPSTAA
ncbi:pyridoxal-dependent decarboxylase, exosortase A system-associated [Sphingomonas sp.]|jgi:diaminopimelate decarboxylase|uniref:pyridoxal-dependent decarboxylase, exosortase A system-associated n=1 Tax=Sphingomonas sp. TaxID=28214 RepID=UPI002E35E55C|nr:pyridoxal-dependent decarboxylase, exosortase A system-associated [Sphingomonas sp.]HEX4693942.1 pyridoxal-dependent decarboxylase, exosortase A system-associated [Sphingomonas sp.]